MTQNTDNEDIQIPRLSDPVSYIAIRSPKTDDVIGWVMLDHNGKMLLFTYSNLDFQGWVKIDNNEKKVFFTPSDFEQQNNS
jgi:hypothetical protein